MAARETQVLHIALIIFVGLTVVLFVVSFFIFRSYQEEQIKVKAAQEAKIKVDAALRTAGAETDTLRGIIGAGPRDAVSAVQENFAQDMKKYGANFPPAKQNYRSVLEYQNNQFVAADQGRIEVADKVKDLEAKMAALEQERVAEVAKYKAAEKKSVDDLASQRDLFNKDRERMEKEKSQIAGQLDTIAKQVEKTVKDKDAEIQKLKGDNKKLTDTNEGIRTRADEEIKVAELPDGAVKWVNQRLRIVWINRGSDDGLRTQNSFSVIGKEETNPIKAEKKGKLEVIRIVDRHMAEARIVEDKLDNPIMPGDLIFSPVWQPGQTEHFALAGVMDINDDGISDRKLVRDLIVLNGGVIDGEDAENGKVTGEVTVHTRDPILGDRPTDKSKEDARTSFTTITKQAQVAGVPTMSLKDFLNYVGYKPKEQSIQLGHEADELAALKAAKQSAKAKLEAAKADTTPFVPRTPKPTKKVTF